MISSLRKLSIPVLALTLLTMSSSEDTQQDHYDACARPLHLQESLRIAPYDVLISYDEDWICGQLSIERDGKVIHREIELGEHYSFGETYVKDDKQRTQKAIGHITGTEAPTLVVSTWSGGAHCCFSLIIFELGAHFRKVAQIRGGNYHPFLEDLNGDGIPEIHVTDDFLAYRFSSFAFSATARVIFKYINGSYQTAPEYMFQKEPDLKAIQKLAKQRKPAFASKEPDFPPPPLIQDVTDLLFRGSRTAALNLLDLAWPKDLGGKENFLQEYNDALKSSEHYALFPPELKAL